MIIFRIREGAILLPVRQERSSASMDEDHHAKSISTISIRYEGGRPETERAWEFS